METRTVRFSVTYFPHTFLAEDNFKRVSLYFDSTRLLQVSPNVGLGLHSLGDNSELLELFCPLAHSPLLESVEMAYQTYRQMGNLHHNGGLVELLRSFVLKEDAENSRTGMVSYLRKNHPRLAAEEAELVNDAVFLILAHQFDREHAELDLQLDRIRGLETELHQEVGIGTDDEAATQIVERPQPLESDHPHTRYPLARLRAWTRLYSAQESAESCVPLTTSIEVVGEICERLSSQVAFSPRRQPPLQLVQCTLATLPDPQTLSLEDVLEMRESLGREGTLTRWWQAITTLINRWRHEPFTEKQCNEPQDFLQGVAGEFRRHWPTTEGPLRFLRLQGLCYPGVETELAFALASGLQLTLPTSPSPQNVNGISLLLSPSGPPVYMPNTKWSNS